MVLGEGFGPARATWDLRKMTIELRGGVGQASRDSEKGEDGEDANGRQGSLGDRIEDAPNRIGDADD